MKSDDYGKMKTLVSDIMANYNEKPFIQYGIVDIAKSTNYVVYFVPIYGSFIKFWEYFDDEECHNYLYKFIDKTYGDVYNVVKNTTNYTENHGHIESVTIYLHKWK